MPARRVVLLLAVGLAAACRSRESPSDVGLRAYLVPDTVRVEQVRDGVLYYYLWSPRGPWAVHLLEVDLTRCELGFQVLSPRPGAKGKGRELKRVSELLREAAPGAIAAVNGDLFTPEGQPLGTEVSSGVVRVVRRRPAFAWHPGKTPWIGAAGGANDSTLTVGWSVHLDRSDGHTEVISGFPELLHGGTRVGGLTANGRRDRHPRSGVGYDLENRRLWLVVVDGRQEGYSAGMSLPELTGLFEALGAREALNLDGGGSSVIVIGDRIANQPSDPHGERAVANALVVREDPALCDVAVNR